MDTLRYFWVLLFTLRYFEVLWGTFVYFEVLLGTLRLLGPVKRCTLYISILGPKISDEVQVFLHRKWVHYHMVQTVSRLDYVYKVPRNEHSNTAPLRIRSLIILLLLDSLLQESPLRS